MPAGTAVLAETEIYNQDVILDKNKRKCGGICFPTEAFLTVT